MRSARTGQPFCSQSFAQIDEHRLAIRNLSDCVAGTSGPRPLALMPHMASGRDGSSAAG